MKEGRSLSLLVDDGAPVGFNRLLLEVLEMKREHSCCYDRPIQELMCQMVGLIFCPLPVDVDFSSLALMANYRFSKEIAHPLWT